MASDQYLDRLVHEACNPPSLPGEVRAAIRHAEAAPADPADPLGPWRAAALRLAAFLEPDLRGALPGYGIPADAMYEHAIACGSAFGHLVDDLGEVGFGHGHLSALLHDFGMLVLDRHIGDDLLHAAGRDLGRERGTFGIHHAWLGALTARAWKLPDGAASGIAFHHHPAHAPGRAARRLAHLLALADHVALEIGRGDGLLDRCGTRTLLRRTGLSSSRFSEVCRRTQAELAP